MADEKPMFMGANFKPSGWLGFDEATLQALTPEAREWFSKGISAAGRIVGWGYNGHEHIADVLFAHGEYVDAVKGADGASNGGRIEAIREQLSEILFGDEGHSVAQCLAELRRRETIVALATTKGEVTDFWDAMEAQLKEPTDTHRQCPCEACGEDALCEYRDSTLVNAARPDGKGAWMCDECHAELRRQP